jgi:catechol-2,3-dioxygenase
MNDPRSRVRGFAELTLMAEGRDALASFYEVVFAMRRLSEDDDRIWLAVGDGARLGIWSPGAKEHNDRGGRHVHFAFSVTPGTLDDIVARARTAGLEPEGPVRHDGGDRSTYLSDPAGNRVEAWDFYTRETEPA